MGQKLKIKNPFKRKKTKLMKFLYPLKILKNNEKLRKHSLP